MISYPIACPSYEFLLVQQANLALGNVVHARSLTLNHWNAEPLSVWEPTLITPVSNNCILRTPGMRGILRC